MIYDRFKTGQGKEKPRSPRRPKKKEGKGEVDQDGVQVLNEGVLMGEELAESIYGKGGVG